MAGPVAADVDGSVAPSAAGSHRFDLLNELLKTMLLTVPGVTGPSPVGVVVRLVDGTGVARALTSGSSRLTIVAPDGSFGNPTLDVAEAAIVLGNLAGVLPVAKGGTGQATVALAFDALSPSGAKGDLIVHDGTQTQRLPVGADGTVALADSSTPLGLRYANLNAAAVAESFVPSAYSPSSATVEGHLVGINGGLAGLLARVSALEGGGVPAPNTRATAAGDVRVTNTGDTRSST